MNLADINFSGHHLITIYLICFTIITTSALGSGLEAPGLYSSTDDVLRLEDKTFHPTVFEQNKGVTFVVQFYNSFCGHCQLFAPIYKELATRVKNWASVVRVAGIDCAQNAEACSENKIGGYPTIYIFPPNSKFKNQADAPLDLRSLPIPWTVDDIEEAIITYVGNLTQTQRKYPKAITAMDPIKVSELSQVQRLYQKYTEPDESLIDMNGLQDLLLIVESDKSFLGRKLILEYFRISAKVEIRRILLGNKQLLKKILSKEAYSQLEKDQPLLLRVNSLDEGAQAQVLVCGELDHILPTVDETERLDYVTNRFKTFLDNYYSVELKELLGYEVDVSDKRKSEKKVTNKNDKQHSEIEINYLIHDDPIGSKKVFAQDLLKGISFMLTHEIRVKGDIKPSEYNTIRNLLTILRKYLPIERWDSAFSRFIETMRTKLDEDRTLYNEKGISNQQMKDLLDYSGSDEIRLKYNEKSWISCYENDRQLKGYTCSLWLLFHALTVGEYTKIAPVRSKPTLVLTTMRDYIINFFGCTVCSSNFKKEARNLETEIQARNSSVLWLWNAHNHINQRLNNEKDVKLRKRLIDAIYPSHNRCQKCYMTDVSNIGIDGKTLDDIEWNMPGVLDFMVELYKPDNLISPLQLSLLLRGVRDKAHYDIFEGLNGDLVRPFNADLNSSTSEKWNIQDIFSTSDMSICLSLYLLCIIIVALVWFAYSPRWRRINKTK